MSTRPPSSGAPGSRLKTPRMTFTTASHTATVGSNVPGATTASNSDREQAERRCERERGRGPGDRDAELVARVVGSVPSFDTPPSSHSVMPSTVWPWRRATIGVRELVGEDRREEEERRRAPRPRGRSRGRAARAPGARRPRASRRAARRSRAGSSGRRPRCRRSGRGESSVAWRASSGPSGRNSRPGAHPSPTSLRCPCEAPGAGAGADRARIRTGSTDPCLPNVCSPRLTPVGFGVPQARFRQFPPVSVAPPR